MYFSFSNDFLLGTANSAFQSEGAWNRDGKTMSMMDHFAREFADQYQPVYKPGSSNVTCRDHKMTKDLPNDGCFFYDNYEAYIEDMQKTGQNTFRMSIAWTRIIPTGYGEVNQKGIDFYNKVINKLLACGITPFVDLLHWDLPQCLFEQGGYCSEKFPEWFEAYAKVCFEAFGDRVKLWSTFNESAVAIMSGYNGRFPPFEIDRVKAQLAAHHVLLAHFRAVRLYKSMQLGGKIGAVNCIIAIYPAHMRQEDIGAARRQIERRFDWWTEPMLLGHYPEKLLEECPAILADMPENFREQIQEAFIPMDFIGLNYYVANRTEYNPDHALLSSYCDNFYSQPGETYVPYPPGLLDCLMHVREKYGDVEIYITENGYGHCDSGDEETECNDEERVVYLREHLRLLSRACKLGFNVKGYYYWNDADSYEQMSGFNDRFGLTWVDHKTGRRRWKKSRHYFSEICKTHMVD